MTNDEAIKYLGYLKDNYTRQGSLMCHAVETAIAALKPKQAHTNGDRIRQMTDEELANILKFWLECDECPCNDGDCGADCFYAACKWLKQDASEVQE